MLCRSKISAFLFCLKGKIKRFDHHSLNLSNIIAQSECINDHKIRRQTFYRAGFRFSNQKEVSNSAIKVDNKEIQQKATQKQQQPETIQITMQEFNKMKGLLEQLKGQISQLQNEQKQMKLNKNTKVFQESKSVKRSAQFSEEISQEITSFTKKLQQTEKLTKSQQTDENLFFKSQEHKLSFKLLSLNVKQQFGQLAQEYLQKFTNVQNLVQSKESQKLELVKLLKFLYLIVYRYTSLENTKFHDLVVRGAFQKITLYADLLQEFQIQKIMSLLVQQVKINALNETGNVQNGLNKQVSRSNKKDIQIFIQKIKGNLLQNARFLRFRNPSNKNSEVLSLFGHFFQAKDTSNLLSQLNLQKYSADKTKLMIYNPLNLSHLLINSILNSLDSISNQAQTAKWFELCKLSLSLDKKQYLNTMIGDKALDFQKNLTNLSSNNFLQLQYEGLIFFIENCPSNKSLLFDELVNDFFTDKQTTSSLAKFNSISRLRIYLSLLIRPQASDLSSNYANVVILQIWKLLISPSVEENLLQLQKRSTEGFQAGQNMQFIHLKKMAMILSQIGIQLFKNSRQTDQILLTAEIKHKIGQIVTKITHLLNKICMQKLDTKDLFKQQELDCDSEYNLVLDLSLFEFAVNLNILSKFSAKLSNDSLKDQQNTELLKNLVFTFLALTKINLSQPYTVNEDKTMHLPDQIIIMLLIGKQNPTILKSLQFYLSDEQENKQTIAEFLGKTVGKNVKHKYHSQYLKLQQEFRL